MKKFTFALDVVKDYKEKLLDNLKVEQAAILAAILEQKKLIRQMEETERLVNEELNEKNSNGIAPHELVNYKRYLRVLQNDINIEYEKLKKLGLGGGKKERNIRGQKRNDGFRQA